MSVRRVAVRAKLSLLLAATGVVSFGQIWSGDSGYAAKCIEETGQVSVLKDSTPWALNVGDQIQVKQLIITGWDGQARFSVSDGSTFDVYPNSRVVFRKGGTPNWRDLLDVLVGRVRVHIEHLYGPNPNRVLTPTAVISVRGTTFDISVDDEDETTTVEVEEGTVEVQHALLPRGNSKTLTTGDSIRVYRNVPIAANRLDKGDLAKRVLRAAVDAINTWESRIPTAAVVQVSAQAILAINCLRLLSRRRRLLRLRHPLDSGTLPAIRTLAFSWSASRIPKPGFRRSNAQSG